MIGPVFPRFCVDLSPNHALPSLFRGRVGYSRVSCGTGFCRHALLQALGEAVERQISFVAQKKGIKTGTLKRLPDDLGDWFLILFGDAESNDLEEWQFHLDVMGIRGQPRVVLGPVLPHTLGPHPDDRFMPIRDSSGCARHTNLKEAEANARKELYERQALTAFWYFDHINFAVEIDNCLSKSLPLKVANLLDVLKPSGRVILYDISLVNPFRVILAVFLAKNKKVKFSAGAGAALLVKNAANKALLELYQAIFLMDQLIDHNDTYGFKEDIRDKISTNYLESNNSSTIAEFEAVLDTTFTFDLESPQVPNWRANVTDCKELMHHQTLKFGTGIPDLTYCSTHLISGFPTMSPLSSYPAATEMAAKRFGLGLPRRAGPIPFG